MVHLAFDASAIKPDRRYALTFAPGKTHWRWDDRRTFDFDGLADLFRVAPVGPKDGMCYTPAVFDGTQRLKAYARQIDVAVLDSDTGQAVDGVIAAIRAHGWRAIVHSTHSHMSGTTLIGAPAYDVWRLAHPSQTVEDYLTGKLAPHVLVGAAAELEGKHYRVHHQPCPKYRILVPIERPWARSGYPTQAAADAAWKERIEALAATLGLTHDKSGVDTARLFYLPRRRSADADYEVEIIDGRNCPIWTLAAPHAAASAPLLRVVTNAHRVAASPNGRTIDLTVWAGRYAGRYEVVRALRRRAPGLFGARVSGVKHHLECPCADRHITGALDRTGCYAVNASDLPRAGLLQCSGFVIHCMHGGCAGLDRLDHLARLIAAGALAIDDLTDPAFLVPEPGAVDVSAIMAREPLAEAPEAPAEGNISAALYADLPGVLGAIHGFLCATAPKPQPVLALGAALAFMAAALGQRVMLSGWGTRPNIYVVGIGHSGSGKERCLSGIKAIARAAGCDHLIGVEDVASDSGIANSVIKQPRQVMLIDEISHLINSAKGKNAPAHLANVKKMLMALYSSSHTTFKSKAYADTDRQKAVDQPCASLLGLSTPDGLFSSLSKDDITGGLLSRVTLFDAGDRDPLQVKPKGVDVPQEVVDWVRAWDALRVIEPIERVGFQPVIRPVVIVLDPAADAVFVAFLAEMHEAKLAARERGTDAVYVRAGENAAKFALLRACGARVPPGGGVDAGTVAVSDGDMQWGCALSRATVERMERAVREDMVTSEFQMKLFQLRKFIRGGGMHGRTAREIGRNRVGQAPAREMDDLYAALERADMARLFDIPVTSGKRRAWVEKQFWSRLGYAPSQD